MKYLLVGLGNIGPEYELTRHNIGFLTLDRLAEKHKAAFTFERLAFKAEIKHKGRSIFLIKPTTFMNLSGKSVNYWMKELKVPLENILVISDDLALPFGKLRMRAQGSNAGHNGLKDIEATLGTVNYPRLRMGIGDDFRKGKQIDYVLGRFSEMEFKSLPEMLDRAGETALSFCAIGIERTMNFFND